MINYMEVLSKVGLFKSIAPDELASMLKCLNAITKDYQRKEAVFLAGDRVDFVGIVLEGSLHIIHEDSEGTRTIISHLAPGSFFAEMICCSGVEVSPVSVLAESDAKVMLLGFQRILHTCPNSCKFHTKLIENMLSVIAKQNLTLQKRMEVLSKKSIRARLLEYLNSFDSDTHEWFVIPFNREELADFLCVDRSALSRELGKLKKEGVLDYRKNKFSLKQGICSR